MRSFCLLMSFADEQKNDDVNILGIIPARYGSTRLPGKPLIKVHGKTIVQRVYERVRLAKSLTAVVVATDDVRIHNHVRKFGGRAVMTRIDHPSGTMRCAEVATTMPEYDLIINIQGDEPLIDPDQIDSLCHFIAANEKIRIATLVRRIGNPDTLFNPNTAKAVLAADGRVLCFSRQAIPHVRDAQPAEWFRHTTYFKHIGMYAYRRATLLKLAQLPQSALESAEKLEQLNWLYYGFDIHAAITEIDSYGVDTEEDVEMVEGVIKAMGH